MLFIFVLFTSILTSTLASKTYGVNIGGWLVSESYINPKEWQEMGGEICDDCTQCVSTEWDLTKKLGKSKANSVFQKHYNSWFTSNDVDEIVKLKLNTVRIPIGFWIIESLVKSTEYYPQGSLDQLRRGLKLLKKAGIKVILDLHAMPGGSSIKSTFAGRCVSDPGFYKASNYERALKAAAVLTALIHTDPAFSTVYALEALNEPIQDASKTPDLISYYKNFSKIVRATEQYLGMHCPSTTKTGAKISTALTSSYKKLIQSTLKDQGLTTTYYVKVTSKKQKGYTSCLQTMFMDPAWQYTNPGINNPTKAVEGSVGYDKHLYLSFGGVADATEDAYMTYMCNHTKLYRTDIKYGAAASKVVVGEWWLAAQFEANVTFYKNFGDAQKLAYSTENAGWIYWNFKMEKQNKVTFNSTREGILRSYSASVAAGYLTADPRKVFNKNVCDGYV